MTGNLSGDEALVRSLLVCDDGCDWTAWHVWRMGERQRISEHVFALPPVRPQVVSPTIKPKQKQRQKRKAKRAADF
ncbi:hypothetical protein HAX39_05465 [Citrobacter freundii]|nr:hypothetical protein [Citrobacter freundii]